MNELSPLESIFFAALEKAPAERASYLAEACTGDDSLRRRVEKMLLAHADANSFLEVPPAAIVSQGDPTIDQSVAEKPGTQIGPYKLLQQIGEGGMGVVYMAEQKEPVERRVALKIIKPGMDTQQVIGRFEAERQALAMMDHPNIAKVFDAGATDSGRPYFVMELVRGIPITKYCDEHQLALKQRLELFLPVCQAVQHAHQKGIIHRDLKPTNVLVAQYDDKPVPKVIDFGVAKAAQKLTELTMFTEFGQVVGTLEYMSPEQARLNQIDIDTRSDIYSLGVLLYELLTGSTPFDGKRLRSAAFDEMLRIIREEEPPKPSTRLTGAETLSSIAANRNIEPIRLSRAVRGELDWIVMKALEKDRNRRYETANGFAADLQRYLNDEQVQACPPSAAYRFRKLARRYKGPLAAAASLAVVLVIATVFSTWQAVRATRAEQLAESRLKAETEARRDTDRARQQAKAEAQKAKTEAAIAQAVNDFLNHDLLAQANTKIPFDRYNEPTAELRLLTVLNRAAGRIEGRFPDQPLVEAALRQTIGHTYGSLGDSKRSQLHLQRAVELRRAYLGEEHPDTLNSLAELAWVKGDADLRAHVLEIRRRILGKEHPSTLSSMYAVAMAINERGEKAKALEQFRDILKAQRRVLGDDHISTAWTKHLVACVQHPLDGNVGPSGAHGEEIERLYREALSTLRSKSGDGSWHTFDVTLRLGQFLNVPGHYERAEAVFQDGYTRLQSQPAAPPEWSTALAGELNGLYRNWNKPERAAEWERKRSAAVEAALSRSTRTLRERFDDPDLLLSHASLLTRLDQLGEAEAACLMALELDSANPSAAHHLHALADAYFRRRDWDKAERLYRRVVTMWRQSPGSDRARAGDALHMLAITLREKRELPAAEAVHREALSVLRKERGDGHVTTSTAAHDLAFVLKQMPGREAEAEQLYREALVVRRRVLGEGDVATVDTAFRLAEVVGARGQYEEADSLLRDAHAALAANRDSGPAREYEPHLLRSIVEHYRAWGKPERAAEWDRRLLEAELAAVSDEVRAKPDDPKPLTHRAVLHVRSGRFEQAAADLDRLLQVDPAEHRHWYLRACLLAYLGDEKGYRQHCEAMLRQFADATDKYTLDRTTKAALLLPEGAGGDVQMLARRAEKTYTLDPKEPWFAMLRGIAEYRAGRFESANQWLTKSLEEDYAPRTIAVDAYLAMAHHRHAQPADAQAALDRCIQRIDKDLEAAEDWPENWLIAHIARREAEQLLPKRSSGLSRPDVTDEQKETPPSDIGSQVSP